MRNSDPVMLAHVTTLLERAFEAARRMDLYARSWTFSLRAPAVAIYGDGERFLTSIALDPQTGRAITPNAKTLAGTTKADRAMISNYCLTLDQMITELQTTAESAAP